MKMKKVLTSLACVAILGVGVSSGSFANTREAMSGSHTFENENTRAAYKEFVGGGVWEYATWPVVEGGGVKKRCTSEYLQRARKHSSYAKVGNTKHTDIKNAGMTSYDVAIDKLEYTAIDKWNNL